MGHRPAPPFRKLLLARAAGPASARPWQVDLAERVRLLGAGAKRIWADMSRPAWLKLACRVSDLRLVWLQFARPVSPWKMLRRAWMAVGGRKREQTKKQEGGHSVEPF